MVNTAGVKNNDLLSQLISLSCLNCNATTSALGRRGVGEELMCMRDDMVVFMPPFLKLKRHFEGINWF